MNEKKILIEHPQSSGNSDRAQQSCLGSGFILCHMSKRKFECEECQEDDPQISGAGYGAPAKRRRLRHRLHDLQRLVHVRVQVNIVKTGQLHLLCWGCDKSGLGVAVAGLGFCIQNACCFGCVSFLLELLFRGREPAERRNGETDDLWWNMRGRPGLGLRLGIILCIHCSPVLRCFPGRPGFLCRQFRGREVQFHGIGIGASTPARAMLPYPCNYLIAPGLRVAVSWPAQQRLRINAMSRTGNGLVHQEGSVAPGVSAREWVTANRAGHPTGS